MIQVSPEQVTPQLKALFRADDPASLRCFAVPDGNADGRVWRRSEMNRSDWLTEQRREAEKRYDTLWAPFYGENGFALGPNT